MDKEEFMMGQESREKVNLRVGKVNSLLVHDGKRKLVTSLMASLRMDPLLLHSLFMPVRVIM